MSLFERIQMEEHIKIARNAILGMDRLYKQSTSVRGQLRRTEASCVGMSESDFNLLKAALQQALYSFIPNFSDESAVSDFMRAVSYSECNRTSTHMEAIGYLSWAYENVPVVESMYEEIVQFGDNLLPDNIWNKVSDSYDEYIGNHVKSIPKNMAKLTEDSIITSAWGELEDYMKNLYGEYCTDNMAKDLTKYQSDLNRSKFKEYWQQYQCAKAVLENVYGLNMYNITLYNYGPKTLGGEYDRIMNGMWMNKNNGSLDFDLLFITMTETQQSQVRSLMRQYSIFNTRVIYSISEITDQNEISTFLSFIPGQQ